MRPIFIHYTAFSGHPGTHVARGPKETASTLRSFHASRCEAWACLGRQSHTYDDRIGEVYRLVGDGRWVWWLDAVACEELDTVGVA